MFSKTLSLFCSPLFNIVLQLTSCLGPGGPWEPGGPNGPDGPCGPGGPVVVKIFFRTYSPIP